MYGPYVNMINELHRTRYTVQLLSYYDACSERKQYGSLFGLLTPLPFSEYYSGEEFGGITFTERLLSYGLNNLISAKEKYMQAYFQTCLDNGVYVDHTQKWGKVIRLSGRKGKVFTANYTVLGLKGKL